MPNFKYELNKKTEIILQYYLTNFNFVIEFSMYLIMTNITPYFFIQKTTLLLILILFSATGFSQDLIVKQNGDSINCTIIDVKDGKMNFSINIKKASRKTYILLNELKYSKEGFYEKTRDNDTLRTRYKNYRLAINGGYNYLFGEISNSVPLNLRKHVQKLKSGYHIAGDIHFYISKSFGIGVKHYYFFSANEIENITVETLPGYPVSGKWKDKIKTTFSGPSLSMIAFEGALVTNFSLGYMTANYENTSNGSSTISKGKTMGISLDLGYDIHFSKSIILGLQVSYVAGSLGELTVGSNTYKLGTRESLNRIVLSAGIRFGE